MKSNYLPHFLLILGCNILLVATCYFGFRLYHLSGQQEQLKEDYSTANSITFGIFSLDLWRDRLSFIVTHKIKDFKLGPQQKREMAQEVEEQLHGMINEVVREFEKPQKGLGNKLKKFAFKQLVEPKELHTQVPSFARTIVNRINAPRAIDKLKGIATSEFKELAEQTYDSTATAQAKMTSYLFQKYKVNSLQAFNSQLDQELSAIRKVTYNYAYAMLACAFAALFSWFPLRKQTALHNTLFVMCLFIALSVLMVVLPYRLSK